MILHGRVSEHRDGEVNMQAGGHSDEMFVLLDGQVLIESHSTGGKPAAVNVGHVREVFGVAALTCGKSRVATVTAVGSAGILALNWRCLQGLARFCPRSACILFRNLTAISGERLANQVATQPAASSAQSGAPSVDPSVQ